MTADAGGPAAEDGLDPRVLRRRVRAVRRWLGRGPYLHAGCGTGALLALLAERGSASGWEPDPVAAAAARQAAPGCPVHTELDEFAPGVFRAVVVDRVTGLADLARLLVPGGGVLLIGDLVAPDGFTVERAGREGRWSGRPVRVLRCMIGP